MSLIRQTLFIAAENSFALRVAHVSGVNNAAADALSRLQIGRFRTLHPTAAAAPTPLPPALAEFLDSPTEACTTASGYEI